MSQNKLTLLLLDDDDASLRLTERLLGKLSDWELDCISCNDICDLPGLKLAITDVVIVDYLLGIENGIDVIQRLKKEGWDSAFILLTGRGDERVAAEALRVGVHDYIIKKDLSVETLDRSLRYVTECRAHQLALQQLNRELEARVEQRTQELKNSNDSLQDTLMRLSSTQLQLVESEKMAALGSLVAGIAHEINTPIGVGVTAVSHLHELLMRLERHKESNSITRLFFENFCHEAKESIEILEHNLNRSAELIGNFKQVAVDQLSGDQREFDLGLYLEDIVKTLKPNLRRQGHKVQVNCPKQLKVYSYPGAFYQILSNLIMNSLIHGFTGKQHGQIFIQVELSGNQLNLSYSDDGSGMSEREVARVFEPFFTTKRGKGGSGLGGHIIYNLVVQQLKGSILCHSEPDNGCCFEIKVPVELV